MYRLGRPAVGHAGLPVHSCAVACQVPPLLLSMTTPALKPLPLGKLGLHGPHQAAATYCVPPTVTASSAVTWELAFPPSAERTSKTLFQSVAAPVLAVVPATPASEVQTNAPPATRCLGSVRSMLIGAMKRGSGSDGVMKCQFAPPSVDFRAVSPVYSVITFCELSGSTRVYPPSPPKTCTELTVMGRLRSSSTVPVFGNTLLLPLSCMPP